MLKFSKIKTKKIKTFFKNLPLWLAERSFLSLLLFIFIALILGGLVFYRYYLTIEKKEIEIKETTFRLNEKNFENILKILQEKDKKFKEADFKEYFNPFHD
jgi:hypothetical protein